MRRGTDKQGKSGRAGGTHFPLTRRMRPIALIALIGLGVGLGGWLGGASPLAQEAGAEKNGPAGLKSLKYRLVGPAWGGRVTRVAGVPNSPVFYTATASGGVWKSSDQGITWESIWDDQPIASIGSIAVAPSDPNVIYVGSGEANMRGNVAAGNGIYK